MNVRNDDWLKKQIYSQPPSRKSRSISRYFLGTKRASIDNIRQDYDIHRCLISIGIFDSYELWTNVTLYRDDTTCRRLFILTSKNELIIGKYLSRAVLFKLKYRLDLTELWFTSDFQDSVLSEVTSLSYFDGQRSMIIGWPLATNYLVEFETRPLRNLWQERIRSRWTFFWQLHQTHLAHVRIVIDQNYDQSDQNHHSTSFLIRKVIGIRPEETVRDLIRKSIDAFHLPDPSVDNYILYVKTHGINTQTSSTHLPLIGHEHPYSIKMKHLKLANTSLNNPNSSNRSFDGDEHSSLQNQYNSSSTSLNHVSSSNYHDFELQKRERCPDNNPTKKHRFFHKRRTKTYQQISEDAPSSSTPYLSSPTSTKSYSHFFGQHLDDLIEHANQQLPSILMQLLEVLYYKGPETVGIFRKVANARAVKECIERIERSGALSNADLHPILAAGLFKHFLRTLPEPIFHAAQYDNWKKCLRLSAPPEKLLFARKNILCTLSSGNHLLLKGLICVLQRIAENCDGNGMNPFNLGLCVSNSLFKTESTSLTSGKQEADVMSSIVEFLIQNCSSLFGSDILTCIPDKRILLHQLANLTYPTASSVESLDEVESSPHLPKVNRSRDSGLAASDLPFNDDSSEMSEQSRRANPNWADYISVGRGPVISIIPPVKISSIPRRRSSKNTYKPSKQFLEREKLTKNTTDDSEEENHLLQNNSSSIRSSTTTIQNLAIGKMKRSKSLSRHSSLGSNEQKNCTSKQSSKEPRRAALNDVKRATSLKQIPYSSDDEKQTEETSSEQQDLDLISEPLIKPSRRTFVHSAHMRPFTLPEAIQMKPIEHADKRRPCHRQNALRFKVNEQKRSVPSPQTFSLNLPPDDLSWSVKEKARFFEHTLSTGRENYV